MVHCIAVRFVKIELLFKLETSCLFLKHYTKGYATHTKVMNFGDNNRYKLCDFIYLLTSEAVRLRVSL